MSQNTSSAVMQQRSDSIAIGLRWYFTGQPCSRGHIAKRSVSNHDCRACVDARKAAKRAADPEKYRARDRAYHAVALETRRASAKASRAKHIEKRRTEDRERYLRNPDPYKANAIRWARFNKGKRAAIIAARRAWIKLATPPWLTTEHKAQIRALYLEAASREGEWHVDHIYPLRAKNSCGLNVPWNLQLLTGDENRRKGNRV